MFKIIATLTKLTKSPFSSLLSQSSVESDGSLFSPNSSNFASRDGVSPWQSVLFKWSALQSDSDQRHLARMFLAIDDLKRNPEQKKALPDLFEDLYKEASHLSTSSRLHIVSYFNSSLLKVWAIKKRPMDYDVVLKVLFKQFKLGLLTKDIWLKSVYSLIASDLEEAKQLAEESIEAKDKTRENVRRLKNDLDFKYKRLKESLPTCEGLNDEFTQFITQLISIDQNFAEHDGRLKACTYSPDVEANERRNLKWKFLSELPHTSDHHDGRLAEYCISLFHNMNRHPSSLKEINSQLINLITMCDNPRFKNLSSPVQDAIIEALILRVATVLLDPNDALKQTSKQQVASYRNQLNRSLVTIFNHRPKHAFLHVLYDIFKEESQTEQLGSSTLFIESTFILAEFVQAHLEPLYGEFSKVRHEDELLSQQRNWVFQRAQLKISIQTQLCVAQGKLALAKTQVINFHANQWRSQLLLRLDPTFQKVYEEEQVALSKLPVSERFLQKKLNRLLSKRALSAGKKKYLSDKAYKKQLERTPNFFSQMIIFLDAVINRNFSALPQKAGMRFKFFGDVLKTHYMDIYNNFLAEQMGPPKGPDETTEQPEPEGKISLSTSNVYELNSRLSQKLHALKIEDGDGWMSKTSYGGSHPVLRHENMFIKMTPLAEILREDVEEKMVGRPGVAVLVNSLNNVLFGEGTTPTCLVKMTIGRDRYAADISLAVEGKELFDRLLENPNYNIDASSYSMLLILSLIVRLQDNKGDNVLVTPKQKAVCIDYDLAFTEDVVAVTSKATQETKRYPGHRNILFFMNQIQDEIPLAVRALINRHSPEEFILRWLGDVRQKNNDFMEEFRPLVSEEDFNFLRLPIQMKPGLVSEVADRIRVIQDRLKSTCTGEELLKAVSDPLYQHTCKMNALVSPAGLPLSPLEKLYKIYKLDGCSFEELGLAEGALGHEVASCTSKITDFYDNCTVALETSFVEWLSGLELSTFSESMQESIYGHLIALFPSQLTIKDSSVFSDTHLKRIALAYKTADKELTKIVLVDLKAISAAGVMHLLHHFPNVCIEIIGETSIPDTDLRRIGVYTSNLDVYETSELEADILALEHLFWVNKSEGLFYSRIENFRPDLEEDQTNTLQKLRQDQANNFATLLSWARDAHLRVGHSKRLAKVLAGVSFLAHREKLPKAVQDDLAHCLGLLTTRILSNPFFPESIKDDVSTLLFFVAKRLASNPETILLSLINKNTTTLDLSGLKITDQHLKDISEKCLNLTSLNLAYCVNITDRGLTYVLKKSCQLKYLNLASCPELTAAGLLRIKYASKLHTLDISGFGTTPSAIDDHTLSVICVHLPDLTSVKLYMCSQLTDASIRALLQACFKLDYLDVTACTGLSEEAKALIKRVVPRPFFGR